MTYSLKTLYFILLATFSMALLCVLSGKFFPFTFDSLLYISTAENIHRGHGLISTNFFIERSGQDFIPTSLQPPGYPILISFFMLFGLSGYTAGVLVPCLCFLLLPFLLYSIFRLLIPSAMAMAASFVCTFMLPVIKCSLFAWSDIPCLCFSLMALFAAFRVIEKGEKVPFVLILLTGLLAGYAYLIRFVGICLIVSIAIGFIVSWILKVFSKKDFLKIITVYSAGVSLVILPFLYRNWHVFGTIQPYYEPPSHYPIAGSIKDYLEGISIMFFSKPSMSGLVGFFIIVIMVFVLIRSKKMIESDRKVFVFSLVLAMYFLINSIFLIVYQTLWDSSERIDDRYLVQLAWVLMAAVLLAFDRGVTFLKKVGDLKRINIAIALLIAFIIVQTLLVKDFFKSQEQTVLSSRLIQAYASSLRRLPQDIVIVTNLPDLVYCHVQRNVRMLNNYTPNGLLKILAPQRRFVVFLIKGRQNSQWDWGAYSLEWESPEGYTKLFSDKQVDLFTPKN